MTEEDEGKMTWEEIMGRRVGRVVEGLWEGRTQREKSRKEREVLGVLWTPSIIIFLIRRRRKIILLQDPGEVNL